MSKVRIFDPAIVARIAEGERMAGSAAETLTLAVGCIRKATGKTWRAEAEAYGVEAKAGTTYARLLSEVSRLSRIAEGKVAAYASYAEEAAALLAAYDSGTYPASITATLTRWRKEVQADDERSDSERAAEGAADAVADLSRRVKAAAKRGVNITDTLAAALAEFLAAHDSIRAAVGVTLAERQAAAKAAAKAAKEAAKAAKEAAKAA